MQRHWLGVLALLASPLHAARLDIPRGSVSSDATRSYDGTQITREQISPALTRLEIAMSSIGIDAAPSSPRLGPAISANKNINHAKCSTDHGIGKTPMPGAPALIDIDKLVKELSVQDGAKVVIAQSGAYPGGPDLLGAEKLFGPLPDLCKSKLSKMFTLAALPRTIAAHTMKLFDVHRKLEAFIVGRLFDANSAWGRSLLQAADALRNDFQSGSLSFKSRTALSHMIECANNVLLTLPQSLYAKEAVQMYHAEFVDKSEALFNDESAPYQAYLHSFTGSNNCGFYSMDVAVAIAVCSSNSQAIAHIESKLYNVAEQRKWLDETPSNNGFAHIPGLRTILSLYPWITHITERVRSEELGAASSQLLALSNEIVHRSSTIRPISTRSINIRERENILKLHRQLLKDRIQTARSFLLSLRCTIRDDVFERTQEFVNGLITCSVILRSLNKEEDKIVSVFDNITGRRHQMIFGNLPKSAPAEWDEERKFKCIQRLEAAIASVNVECVCHNEDIDKVLATLECVKTQFKNLFTEHLQLSKSMRDLIDIPEDRTAISDIQRRYNSVKFEILAAKKSIVKKLQIVQILVSIQPAYEAVIASNEATLSVLVPLRSEIAAAETIDAVNQSIAKAAQVAEEHENSAKSQAAINARIKTRVSNDAEKANMTWLDAFSRIQTHTDLLEGILVAAYKNKRALLEIESRQLCIQLEKMSKITAEIEAHIEIEYSALAHMHTAENRLLISNARVAAFSKLSTELRLKTLLFDGEYDYSVCPCTL